MKTKVVNLRHSRYTRYVGRREYGMHYGNPFSWLPGTPPEVFAANRSQAVRFCKKWLLGTGFRKVEPRRRKWILDTISDLHGETLGCFCVPLECHGSILADLADGVLQVKTVRRDNMGSGLITLEPGTRAYYAQCGEYEPIVIDGTYENEEGNYGYLYICSRTGNRSRCHHSWIVLTLEEAIARAKLWIEQQR